MEWTVRCGTKARHTQSLPPRSGGEGGASPKRSAGDAPGGEQLSVATGSTFIKAPHLRPLPTIRCANGGGERRGEAVLADHVRGGAAWFLMSAKVLPAPLRFGRPLRYIGAIGTPRVNGRLTRFRHPGTADDEDFGHVDAPFDLRDRPGGRHSRPKDGVASLAYGPAGCRPHSRRAPAAYLPLRAGWALAPGHSGGCRISRNPRAPLKAGAKREGPFP
jgi:hypothetical protein